MEVFVVLSTEPARSVHLTFLHRSRVRVIRFTGHSIVHNHPVGNAVGEQLINNISMTDLKDDIKQVIEIGKSIIDVLYSIRKKSQLNA